MKARYQPLPINPFSRPGKELIEPRFLIIHWVQNARTTAQQNRDFWESRKNGGLGYGGAPFIVDDYGPLQCGPLNEMYPHVGTGKGITDWALEEFGQGSKDGYSLANYYTIGIEMCHVDWEGSFSQKTWNHTVSLAARICRQHGWNPRFNMARHYDVVGWKECPKWFVDYPEEWQRFIEEVAAEMSLNYT